MTERPPAPLHVIPAAPTPPPAPAEPTALEAALQQHLAPGQRTGDRPDPTQLAPIPTTIRSGALLFHQAAPHPDDPPGLIRWCVQQPDGRIRPTGATPADELPQRPPHLTAVPNPED